MLASAQALVHSVVLAIDRQQLAPSLLRSRHHQFARRDQHFLVRERDDLPKFDRFVRRLEPDYSDRCRNNDFRRGVRSYRKHSLSSMVNCRHRRDALVFQPRRKFVGLSGVADRHNLRSMTLNLPDQFFKIAARGQRDHTKPLRHHLDNRQSLPPDRPRRSQNRQFTKFRHQTSSDFSSRIESNSNKRPESPKSRRQSDPESRRAPVTTSPNP